MGEDNLNESFERLRRQIDYEVPVHHHHPPPPPPPPDTTHLTASLPVAHRHRHRTTYVQTSTLTDRSAAMESRLREVSEGHSASGLVQR